MSEATVPRPEYPRPQFERADWLNLNGQWEFAFDDADEGLRDGWWRETHPLADAITVPFPYQSPLSGIGDRQRRAIVWYARDFVLPSEYTGCQIWLHFGAVEYLTQVWLNGEPVGENRGGHVPFAFEVTGHLRPGRNRITLRVVDRRTAMPRDHADRRQGSESGSRPEVTGIWQTVWLEPVSPTHIADLRLTPALEAEAVRLELGVAGAGSAGGTSWESIPGRAGLQLRACALLEGREVAETVVDVGEARVALELPLRRVALWSPEHPFLYDLELTLLCYGMAVDRVRSYFGMREITVSGRQLLLNGQPLYQCLALDRGYFPDGLVTAPSDEALRRDVEMARALGFNGVRKQKVEDPRWLTWCDRLGLLVWEEMPETARWEAAAAEAFVEQWARVVERDYNHPCVVAWAPWRDNPAAGGVAPGREEQEFVEGVLALTRALDRTRPVVRSDGWEHLPLADVEDAAGSPETERAAGYCHPQLTDGERETNGLLTAVRRPKGSPAKIAALNGALQARFRDRHGLPAPPAVTHGAAPPVPEASPRPPAEPRPAPAPPLSRRTTGIPVPVRLVTT